MNARTRARIVRGMCAAAAGLGILVFVSWAATVERIGIGAWSMSAWWIVPPGAYAIYKFAMRFADPRNYANRRAAWEIGWGNGPYYGRGRGPL